MEMNGKGPFTKVGGTVTDAGLFEHVFDGTDDEHDERLKAEKLLAAIKSEMLRRSMIKESFEDTVKMLLEDF